MLKSKLTSRNNALTSAVALLFALLLTFVAQGQSKKYQGLLWMISGNGLSEPSFLYGTMHVSDKLAYNVSDQFYTCLTGAKAVALESAPTEWMRDYRDMGTLGISSYIGDGNFYRDAFVISAPQSHDLYGLLESENSTMNEILYRYSPGSADYEEDTYLDMFIFQSGAKQNKPVYSLETLDEVIDLQIKAMKPDEDQSWDNNTNQYLTEEGVQKYIQLEEAYRRGDLDLIDSLSKVHTPTKVYHQYFIVERNRNMVKRLDSLIRIHSVFTGVGAAHLPGENGMIELLRAKGYEVIVVEGAPSGRGHKMRKKMAGYYRPLPFSKHSTADGNISMMLPGELFEVPSGIRGKIDYLCPEPINGGYFSVTRLFTYGPLFGKTAAFYQASFDSLLYMATPGEIISRADISTGDFKGFQILTRNVKKALICYRIFFTPTEIIILKAAGTHDYAGKSEPQSFFTSFAFDKPSNGWQELSPKGKGMSWKMKGIISQQDFVDGLNDIEVEYTCQAFDPVNGDYFLVMRNSYNDLSYIEEDAFDLGYVAKCFAESIHGTIEDTLTGLIDGLPYSQHLVGFEEPGMGTVTVRAVARGGNYYLMLAKAGEENATLFFNSAKSNLSDSYPELEEYIDSNLLFSVTTAPQNRWEQIWDLDGYYESRDEVDDNHLAESRSSDFIFALTGEEISVTFDKFHDYDGADSEDEFWQFQIDELELDDPMRVSRREEMTLGNGDKTYTFLLTDTASSRGIQMKFHLHGGVLYTLQTVVDTTIGPGALISEFFSSFKPLDTIIGRTVFEDKAELFFRQINSPDSSTRAVAIQSVGQIEFEIKHVSRLIDVYDTFKFSKKNETDVRLDLIMALGDLDSEESYRFLRRVFDENNFNSDIQFCVIRCLSYTESKTAYGLIKSLLLENTPVTDHTGKMNFFDNLYDSLELAKTLFPDLLELAYAYPEYKYPIIELLAWGFTEGKFTTDLFRTYAAKISRDAMVELKKTVSDQSSNTDIENDYYYYYSPYSYYHSLLLDYYALMQGLSAVKAGNTQPFFDGLRRVSEIQFRVECQIVNHRLKIPLDTAFLDSVAQNYRHVVWMYNRFIENEITWFPKTDQEIIAKGLLYNDDPEARKDSIVLVEKRYFNNETDTGCVYFFKRKGENDQNWMVDYTGLQPVDSTKFIIENQAQKMSLAYRNEEELATTLEKALEVFKYLNRRRVVVADDSNWYKWGAFSGYDY